jgi:hypothetical protein
MGIESLFQQNMQNAGLAGSDRLASNAMFPQGQMDKTQYAVPSQLPTSAETIRSDYDEPTNAYTGLTDQPFAAGGIASIPRYDGEDGSVVQAPAPEANPDLANLDPELLGGDEGVAKLNVLKTADPKAYNSQLMSALGQQLKAQYNTNSDYVPTWYKFASLQETDPAQWHRQQLDWLGHHQGWQIGQNTSERNAGEMPAIQNEIEQARKAGLKDDEIQQILSSSQQSANYENQQRIAREAANSGNGLGDAVKTIAPLALMAVAPEFAPFINAGISAIQGADPMKIATNAALSYALPGVSEGISPDLVTGLQGLKTANSLYNVAKSGGQNLGADINAFKGISNLAPVNAAQGGLMAGGGVANLGSYSDGGRLLKGPGDGMSDHIPATIGDKQPARLAEGEFVVPADVVSHLGNGSTDAGAKQLYKMMDNIRRARTGNPKQGKQINPAKFLPKG